jgi:hypothetical protein
MPTVTVNLLDTFDQWRLKTNDIGANLGDLTSLSTTNKTNIVSALNEVVSGDSDDMENLIDDTTPQLGGHLDLNSSNITGTGNIATTGNISNTGNITSTGTITGTSFVGDGSGITNIDLVTDLTPQLGANLDLNSFSITGTGSIAETVIGVTQSTGDNSTKLATTAYVDAQIGSQAANPNSALGGHLSGTISNAIIPNNTITSNMIAAGVIVAQDIAPNAVNGTHIALGSDAVGDTLYYNGTDYARLAKGSAGQVLTMGANNPSWTTVAAGSTVTEGFAISMAIALG